METGIFDYKIDKSKLTKNELIVQQAREDIESGKITKSEFSEIKSKYGDHKKLTKTEYLNLPILKEASEKEGIYREDVDEKKVGCWHSLFVVKTPNDKKVDISLEICEITGDV